MSDDGQHALTAIAFIGSVFSPYYAAARRRASKDGTLIDGAPDGKRAGGADALDHCAMNVALYGSRGSRWSMTERGRSQVEQRATGLTIGRSDFGWRGDALELSVDEYCAPMPRRVRGTILVHPESLQSRSFQLDELGLHHWTPYAPRARIEVRMQHPHLAWKGIGYFDHNHGAAPLEDTFDEWHWSRTSAADCTTLLYDTRPRAGEPRSLALQSRPGKDLESIDAPPTRRLPRTGWGLERNTRSEGKVQLVRTLEDAPFYSRSQLDAGFIAGTHVPVIHETLSLRRFRSRWVQYLLPFRMPRIAGSKPSASIA